MKKSLEEWLSSGFSCGSEDADILARLISLADSFPGLSEELREQIEEAIENCEG